MTRLSVAMMIKQNRKLIIMIVIDMIVQKVIVACSESILLRLAVVRWLAWAYDRRLRMERRSARPVRPARPDGRRRCRMMRRPVRTCDADAGERRAGGNARTNAGAGDNADADAVTD